VNLQEDHSVYESRTDTTAKMLPQSQPASRPKSQAENVKRVNGTSHLQLESQRDENFQAVGESAKDSHSNGVTLHTTNNQPILAPGDHDHSKQRAAAAGTFKESTN
jgi:hypothetical protein